MIVVPPAIQRIPWKLIALLSAITGFGILVLYSAAGGSFTPWAMQQTVRFLVFLTAAMVIGRFPLRIFEDFSYIAYIGVLVLLIAVELLGFVGGGSQRWLNLGFMNLQPSELMKVTIVVALARFYAQLPPGNTRSWTALWPALIMIGLPTALVMLQPDLGTALSICIGGVVVMFVAGLPFWWFGGTAIAGAAALPILFSFLHDYQQKRVLIFLDPESDPLGAGYHISQSKIAIGSGGVGGKGFLNGSQSHLDYLPEGHTDFIFATMAEEWGLIGGLALQIKYTVLPQCVFFGLWALWGQYRHRRSPMGIVALGAVCALLGLLPTALVALGYALAGYWDEFVFANFISFFDRLPAAGGRMRPDIAAFMVPFAALALAGMRTVWQARPAPVPRTYVFVLLWLAASLVTVFLPGTVYRYYLVALVPACVLTSLPFFQPKEPTGFNIPAMLPAVLYLAVMPFQFMATQENRIATEAFARAIAPRIDAAAGRCLFIFDGPTALYRMTDSCIPSRFVYPDHLNNALERYALGVSQEGEVARILATRPPVIITADKAFTPQNPEAMRRVKQALARDYSEIASTTLHNRLVRAWALRD